MKRKVYTTPRERKADQLMGFWAFPIVNVPLWIIYQMLYSRLPEVTATDAASLGPIRTLVSAMPWLVNGIVLVLAFLFRPQLGVGYVTFVAVALTVVTLLGTMFMVACFVCFFSAEVVSLAISLLDKLLGGPIAAHDTSEVVNSLAVTLFFAVFVVLMLGGMGALALLGRSLFRKWQSSGEDTPEAGGEKIA